MKSRPSQLIITAWSGSTLALASALLVGASTPLAKLLLVAIEPLLLAGLLYLGSGFGLALFTMRGRIMGAGARAEAPLRTHDLPWLALVVLFGGVLGPALLMGGLATTAAASGSLLLTTESLATMAIAWIVYRENVDKRVFGGAMAILAGAVLLSWPSGAAASIGFDWGSLLIFGACFSWGIDNNLTRKLSAADPVRITIIKGLAAGVVNTGLALAHAELPKASGSTDLRVSPSST